MVKGLKVKGLKAIIPFFKTLTTHVERPEVSIWINTFKLLRHTSFCFPPKNSSHLVWTSHRSRLFLFEETKDWKKKPWCVSFTLSSSRDQFPQNNFRIVLISQWSSSACPDLHAEWRVSRLFPPTLLCNVAIWWSARVLRIETTQQTVETWRCTTDVCVCVSVHTCRCVLWLCVSSGVHTNTHTHDEVFTVLLCSSAGLHSQNVAPPAAFPLLSIWGKKLKEKKKRTTDFVLKVCLFFRTCLLSLSPRAAQMNPSGEPEIQG